MDLWRREPRTVLVLNQVSFFGFLNFVKFCVSRTDSSGNHVNGQGNYGFCAGQCPPADVSISVSSLEVWICLCFMLYILQSRTLVKTTTDSTVKLSNTPHTRPT